MPLAHHQDTLRRMEESAKLRYNIQNQTAEQRTARERMAYFPSGEDAEVIHVHKDLWVVSHVITTESVNSMQYSDDFCGAACSPVERKALHTTRHPHLIPKITRQPHSVSSSPASQREAVSPSCVHKVIILSFLIVCRILTLTPVAYAESRSLPLHLT